MKFTFNKMKRKDAHQIVNGTMKHLTISLIRIKIPKI